mmetsp:Transcript_23075/g.57311  ORF Transcript_23075/g.57311 Transcript_23075/m.57311 type:complete len:266 (-) Transcript_23075:364-1161(-)
MLEREEGRRDAAREHPCGEERDRHSLSADVCGEHLGGDDVRERRQTNGEGGHGAAKPDHREWRRVNGDGEALEDEGDAQPAAGNDKHRLAPRVVKEGGADDKEDDLARADKHCALERVAPLHFELAEDGGRVVDDCLRAARLTEEGDAHPREDHRAQQPGLGAEHVAPARLLHLALAAPAQPVEDLLRVAVHRVYSRAEAEQLLPRLLVMPFEEQPAGRLGHHPDRHEDEDARQDANKEHVTPATSHAPEDKAHGVPEQDAEVIG